MCLFNVSCRFRNGFLFPPYHFFSWYPTAEQSSILEFYHSFLDSVHLFPLCSYVFLISSQQLRGRAPSVIGSVAELANSLPP